MIISIGDRLRSLRHNKKLKHVAEATGLSISFLSDMERGKSIPSLPTCEVLAQYYEITLSELFDHVYIKGGKA